MSKKNEKMVEKTTGNMNKIIGFLEASDIKVFEDKFDGENTIEFTYQDCFFKIKNADKDITTILVSTGEKIVIPSDGISILKSYLRDEHEHCTLSKSSTIVIEFPSILNGLELTDTWLFFTLNFLSEKLEEIMEDVELFVEIFKDVKESLE